MTEARARPAHDGTELVRARLDAAGLGFRRAESVVVDLAGDPPLGASADAIAREESARIVDGAGLAMVAAGARRGVIAVRSRAAELALKDAIRARLSDEKTAPALRVARVAPLWPTVGLERDLGCAHGWVLDGEAALDLEAAGLGRERAPRRITVAGWVVAPLVVATKTPLSMADAVAAAGGARGLAWVALDGGAPAGRAAERGESVRSSLVLVLPAHHELVRRARTSVGDWLRRAASACEGCRACSEVCPVALAGADLAPHDTIGTLVSGRTTGTRLVAATGCTGCGICDVACPVGLSPSLLVGSVKARLPASIPPPARGEHHPDRDGRRMSIALLVERLGLAAL